MLNNMLSKIANDKRVAVSVIGIGCIVSTIGNLVTLAGVYYLAMRKGIEIREEYESEEN